MNFRTLAASVALLSTPAAFAQDADVAANPKLYASARCGKGEEVRVAKKDTLRCNFKAGSANLSDDDSCVVQLEPVLRALQEEKSVKAMVLGFADAQGKANKNKALSFQRASAVRKYLIDAGIDANRFSVDGFGSDTAFFVCKEKTKECDAQNRRIEIASYICKKPKAARERK